MVGKIPKNVQRLENFVQKSMMFGQGCTIIYIWFSYLVEEVKTIEHLEEFKTSSEGSWDYGR